MLLQENEAATKVQEGKIFHLPKECLTWAGVDFPLHDDDMEEDEEYEEEEEEQEEEEEVDVQEKEEQEEERGRGGEKGEEKQEEDEKEQEEDEKEQEEEEEASTYLASNSQKYTWVTRDQPYKSKENFYVMLFLYNTILFSLMLTHCKMNISIEQAEAELGQAQPILRQRLKLEDFDQ